MGYCSQVFDPPQRVEITHALPFQYWPEGHVVEEPPPVQPVAGVVEQEYKVPLVVLYSVIAELKQFPLESMVCQPVPYCSQVLEPPPPVEITHALPFQYWPEGHELLDPELTHEEPL